MPSPFSELGGYVDFDLGQKFGTDNLAAVNVETLQSVGEALLRLVCLEGRDLLSEGNR